MRCRDFDELARGYDLGAPPERWKVSWVAGNQVVGASRFSAFKENIVVGVRSCFEAALRRNKKAAAADQLKNLHANSLADVQQPSGQYL